MNAQPDAVLEPTAAPPRPDAERQVTLDWADQDTTRSHWILGKALI
jgi:hypothetical protein